MKKKIVTISRQYGSGGRYIGENLAKAMGVPCYDEETDRYGCKGKWICTEFCS